MVVTGGASGIGRAIADGLRADGFRLAVFDLDAAGATDAAGPDGVGVVVDVADPSSVDAGFARDMMAHHNQAVLIAGFVRDHTADPTIRLLAYDIETQQLTEVGLFKGWLDGWGLLAESDHTPMSWMGTEHLHMQSGNLMPGMATTAELAKLKSLTGRPLDIYFLQLMIRHHQGGIPMASYAAEHATVPAVRTAAHKMADAQSLEVINMDRLLRSYGATPLAPPN